MPDTFVITQPDGGMIPVLGHIATIEKAAKENGWSVRGRVQMFGGGTRWYSRDGVMHMAEFGRNGQLTSVVRDDLSKVTGKDRVGQFVELLTRARA